MDGHDGKTILCCPALPFPFETVSHLVVLTGACPPRNRTLAGGTGAERVVVLRLRQLAQRSLVRRGLQMLHPSYHRWSVGPTKPPSPYPKSPLPTPPHPFISIRCPASSLYPPSTGWSIACPVSPPRRPSPPPAHSQRHGLSDLGRGPFLVYFSGWAETKAAELELVRAARETSADPAAIVPVKLIKGKFAEPVSPLAPRPPSPPHMCLL